ncbi:3,4-dihydroxy-2-butanone-4-phosphate synthase [Sphingomonas oryzagri]
MNAATSLAFSRARHPALSSIQEIVEEAKNGRMFILIDDEDRENEGDLVIPAQMATPSAINFMATHGKGLICLAMTEERVNQLGLPPMTPRNGTRHETAFTVSIEALDGVSTGISAGDRARTIAVAIDAAKGPEHIVTPGHVFPLIARRGGVLVRAGHTEAAVDVSRLAGLNPSGVICEVMAEDGTMARLEDLVTLAQKHGLKIGTIRDLIAYRRCHDHNIERISEERFESHWGDEWTAISFLNKAVGAETLVLQKGRVDPAKPTLVRIHGFDIFTDVLRQKGARAGLLGRSMEIIAEAGAGVIVLLARRAPGKVSVALDMLRNDKDDDMPELRDYGVGAQILAELGIHHMILLTNSHRTLVALDGYGLNIVEERPV